MIEKRKNAILLSKGYKQTIFILDELFEKKYKIEKIMFSDDKTTFDFQMLIHLPHLNGVEVSVEQSGESHMYSIGGSGFLGLALPNSEGDGILISGEKGDNFADIIKDESLWWGADIDNIDSVKNYFNKFKKYYEENYC